MDYENIKDEAMDTGDPFLDLAESIVYPMYKRVRYAWFDHLIPDAIGIDEEVRIECQWARAMKHELEMRVLIAECKGLLA